LVNSPHLKSGYELDEAILGFSRDIKKYDCPSLLRSEEDLRKLLETFKKNAFEPGKFWEFYVIDVVKELERIKLFINGKSFMTARRSEMSFDQQFELFQQKCLLVDAIFGRYYRTIHLENTFELLSFTATNSDMAVTTLKNLLDRANLSFFQEYDKDVKTIFDSISNRVKYERLADHGPKMGEISGRFPLFSLFHYLTILVRRCLTHTLRGFPVQKVMSIWIPVNL
jgi:glycogen debranching enzyme